MAEPDAQPPANSPPANSLPSDRSLRADSSPTDSSEGAALFPVFFYRHRQRVLSAVLDVELDIGRQREGEPAPTVRLDRARGGARIILAPIDDVEVSRSHVGIAPAAGGQVRVTNLSRSLPVKLAPGDMLAPGESALATPPVLAQFGGEDAGSYAARVDPVEEEEMVLEGLPDRTIPPGKAAAPASLARLSAGLQEDSLLQWLETVLGVFHSAANSHDFPEQAARAAVKIVGLDAAAMLRCSDDGRWRVEAVHAPYRDERHTEEPWAPSQTLLGRVRRERRTFRQVPPIGAGTPNSLQDVSALVAAPILDGQGRVIGALYGDRRRGVQAAGAPKITAFEAKLVELLASGIAAGLARIKEEQAALEARVQFEQFFTPQLAEQLERDPRLLEGRDANVTVLFADIRGFSRISQRLGPARTMAWIQDTMGSLSDCVLAHDGVLVDYIGDELMAMWGAPVPQSNHAELACYAAREMTAALASINARWQAELGSPVRLGIGLNSGSARVGNTGSPQKFKYGPLGDTVNVASRTQGATKYLGADCLITSSTLGELPEGVSVRRLARVRAVNIEQAIDLYEILATAPPDWDERCRRYHEALAALERDELDSATRLANALAADFPQDSAVKALTARATEADSRTNLGDTSVWQLPGK